MVGDFAFFSNGDILIRRGKYQPGLVDSVLHYLRITNTKPAVATLENEGIYRCNLQNNQCNPFGTNQLDFDSAFHLSINNKTNTVYISDTSRHKLRKFDEQGNEISVADEGFKFPNQNSLVGGSLWVADTNHHAIQKVSAETESFGEILESHPIGNPALQQKNWPYSFTPIGKNWWVNNMSHTMSKGSIAVYDENWVFVKILPLPANADPFDFAVLENQILITDFDNTTIYQLSINGELLKSTLPDEITLKLAQLKESRQFYINLTNGTVLLFVLFLILGFAIAIIQAKKQKNAEPITVSVPLVIDLNNPAIKWLALNKQKTVTIKWLFILLTLGLIATTILIAEIKTTIIMIIATLIMMLLMFINFSKKIGTLDDVLIIKYFNQKYVAGTKENIYFSDNQIMIGSFYIPFNSQQEHDALSGKKARASTFYSQKKTSSFLSELIIIQFYHGNHPTKPCHSEAHLSAKLEFFPCCLSYTGYLDYSLQRLEDHELPRT